MPAETYVPARWIIWIRDSDGQVIGLDSQKWEEGMAISS